MRKCFVCLGAALLLLAGFVASSPASAGIAGVGDFNNVFADHGLATYNRGGVFAPTNDAGHAVAVQPDGRIVVVGESIDSGNVFSTFLILRYLPTGGLDHTFSGDGVQRIGFGTQFARASGVVIDSQGRIIVSGTAADSLDYEHASARFAVTRLLSNGTADVSFNGNGRATTTFPNGVQASGGAESTGLALAANDRPLLVGYVQNFGGGGRTGIATARFTSAGALDATYSGDGKTVHTYAGTHVLATAVSIDWDFRVIMSAYAVVDGNTYLGVLKLTSNGANDAQFVQPGSPTPGFRLYNGYGLNAYSPGIAIQDGGRGRVLLLSSGTVAGSPRTVVLGLDRSVGSLDVSFSGNGYSDVLPVDGINLAVLPNDAIVIVGEDTNRFAAAMLTADGGEYRGFGDGGQRILPPTTGARGVAIGSSGMIYTAGSDDTVFDSVLTTNLYGTPQPLPARPRFQLLARQGNNVVVTFRPSNGPAVTGYRYRYRLLRPNGSPVPFTQWRNTAAPRVVIPTNAARPGFDIEVAGVGQFGPGPAASTRWLVIQRGRSACQPFVPNRVAYNAANRATIVYQRRANQCAVWRLNNRGALRALPRQALTTPVLTLDRSNVMRVGRGSATSILWLRVQ